MKPEFAIKNMRKVGDTMVAEVDTTQATYRGRAWLTLSSFEKRKFQNLIELSRTNEEVKVHYV